MKFTAVGKPHFLKRLNSGVNKSNAKLNVQSDFYRA